MNLQVPYERVVQWLAGPFAAVVGLLAAKAVTHLSFLGSAGLQQSAVAHGITTGAVFVSTALVTYASHQKWLTNLAKWWGAIGIGTSNLPETVRPVIAPPTVPAPVVLGDPSTPISVPPVTTDILRAQLRAANLTPEA